MSKAQLILINKDTKNIYSVSTSFDINDELSLSINHLNLCARNAEETLGFTFNVSNTTVPQIDVSEFCLVIRDKISLTESHKNEHIATKTGKTQKAQPNSPLQENSGFTELKGING